MSVCCWKHVILIGTGTTRPEGENKNKNPDKSDASVGRACYGKRIIDHHWTLASSNTVIRVLLCWIDNDGFSSLFSPVDFIVIVLVLLLSNLISVHDHQRGCPYILVSLEQVLVQSKDKGAAAAAAYNILWLSNAFRSIAEQPAKGSREDKDSDSSSAQSISRVRRRHRADDDIQSEEEWKQT